MSLSELKIKHWRFHAAGAASILLAVGAVYGSLVRPRLASAAHAAESRRELAEVRAEFEMSLSRAKTAQEAAARLESEALKQAITLLPATQLNARVGLVSARAERLGLRILELVPGNEMVEASHVHFPIKLRAVGPASAGPALLRDLHSAFPDLAVVGVTIRANPADAAERSADDGQPARAEALVSVDFEWYAIREGAPVK